jgi:TonB family protein
MATEAQTRGWNGPSRRRMPRFPMQTMLDVTVLRSGIPDTVPGRAVNVCERGIAAMLAEELVPGESVAVEVQLSLAGPPLRARAVVRYQDKLRSGLEFVALTAEQREAIRNWAKEAKAEMQASPRQATASAARSSDAGGGNRKTWSAAGPRPKKKRFGMVGTVLVVLVAFAAGVLWWRWNRGWEDLELGLRSPEVASAEKPRMQVPADVMEKLLVHRVAPSYPAEARKANLQGIIALDIVVGRDGSVVSMRPLNGPESLARAAMDALRWWKFDPYRVNGEPVAVATTVAVEFKR